jgi:hypothetical protein
MRRNPVAHGGTVPLTDPSYDFLLGEGWSGADSWGRWAMGHRAEVHLALETDRAYRIEVEAFGFCPPDFSGQSVQVGWNDVLLGQHTLTSCEREVFSFDLPADVPTRALDTLWFAFENAVSPQELGLSGDPRPLALGIVSIRLVQQ